MTFAFIKDAVATLSPYNFLFWRFGIASLLLIIFAKKIKIDKQNLFNGAIFTSIIAFLLQLHFQKYISSSKTAIIFSLEPVFATLTAAIYLKEQLTLQFFLGAVFIFIAILIAEKRAKENVIPQDWILTVRILSFDEYKLFVKIDFSINVLLTFDYLKKSVWKGYGLFTVATFSREIWTGSDNFKEFMPVCS